MSFYPPEVNGKMDKGLFIKACWGAGAGNIAIIKNVIADFLLGGVVLKIFGLEKYWYLIIIFGVLYLIGTFFFGWFLQKKHFLIREGSLMNKISNPQVSDMERMVRKIYEKIAGRPYPHDNP